MIRFFKGLKRAANFFIIHPDGLRLPFTYLEARVDKLSKLIEDRDFTRMISLEHRVWKLEKIAELEKNTEKLQTESQKKFINQLAVPAERTKTIKKPKALKVKAVEEKVKKVKSKLTQAKVKRLFEYREGELYWKVDRVRAKKGNKAGSISIKGYKQVGIGRNTYGYGRIIFLMFHGYIPECVSYIDGDSKNTRIENLRAVTQSQITCYRKNKKTNNSGYKGVCLHKQTGKYIAQIVKNKKHYHLGLFNTPKEAHKAYCKAAKKLHGEFARVA